MQEFDYIIIGGGVGGFAAGFELSRYGGVLLLETEAQPAMHSSGRSASVFIDFYGNDVVQKLTAASRPFMEVPGDFCDTPLLDPIGGMMVTDKTMVEGADALYEGLVPIFPAWRKLSIDEAIGMVPFLSPDWLGSALLDPNTASIDVHALLQGYARGMQQRGAEVRTGHRVEALAREGARWIVTTPQGRFAAPAVVNAAGAWADEIARLAGVPPIGLVPKKRTVVTFDPPADIPLGHWPIVGDFAETFYFKREAGGLLASPGDTTPVAPCDAQPDDLDVAIAMDRLETVAGRALDTITHKWAGLRSFVRDESPVLGPDPAAPGFHWCAALGGFGFQTSPATARLLAAAICGEALPEDLQGPGIGDYGPRRKGIG